MKKTNIMLSTKFIARSGFVNKFICLCLTFIIVNNSTFSQSSERASGIFYTATDFKNHKASYSYDASGKLFKIKFNDFFCSKFLTVKSKDTTIKIAKSSLYGYQTRDSIFYRFDGKKTYKIVNPGDSFIVYKYGLPRRSTGRINVTPYYYSMGLSGTLITLTKTNVKRQFNENKAFCEIIERDFKYNTDLMATDKQTREFKILMLTDKLFTKNN